MSLVLFFAQLVSNASTVIFRMAHTQSQAPEDEWTSIRNMSSKK